MAVTAKDGVPCPRFGSRVGLALENCERGALRVGDHCEAPDVDLGGRQQRASTRVLCLARGLVGGLDGEMWEPVRWDAVLLLGLLADAAVELADVPDRGVAAVVGVVLPAEQLAEE